MTLIKSISGIRGTIGGKAGENLTPEDIVLYTTAFGTWIKNKFPGKKIFVVTGRDARISGLLCKNLVNSTLNFLGINVIDIDLTTTPTVEIAVINEKAQGGIIISASHNPKQWNALKLINEKGEFLSSQEGMEILSIAKEKNFEFSTILKIGKTIQKNYLDIHCSKILDLDLVKPKLIKKRKFKIVVDGINSSGALYVPYLLKKLGVEDIICINCDITGDFSHDPEPLPENLNDLSKAVIKNNADLGIIVDPDVDRLAFVCEDGEIFGEEYTLVAIADYVLKYEKGNTVSNLSSTMALNEITEKYGTKYFASPVGEVNVVEAMKKNNAVIGGEGNGGVIYPKLHYGRDALAGIALFLSYLAEFKDNNKKSVSLLRAQYPYYHISKNKIEIDPSRENVDKIFSEIAKKYIKFKINKSDGIKIDFDKSWVHLRKSNTEPIIRIYAESDSETKAKRLANKIISDIKEIIKSHYIEEV